MSVGSVVSYTTNATANTKPFIIKSDENPPEKLNLDEVFLLANANDHQLQSAAKKDAYQEYLDDPTRDVSKAVGTAIPFVDSFVQGALKSGAAAEKLGKAVSTGSDWGVFEGVTWLYRKALDKAYETFPSYRKFKQENPTMSYAAELGTTVGVGGLGILGYRKGVKKLTGKLPEEIITAQFEKLKSKNELIAKVFTPIEKIPKDIRGILGLTIFISLGSLIAKNIFDVHKTDKKAEKNYEDLVEKREQARTYLTQA